MKRNPYGTGLIFDAVKPMQDIIDQVEIKRNNPNDPSAKHYAGADFYQSTYITAINRLGQSDMLTIDQAAAHLSVTVQEYQQMAERGAALLIEIEGKKAVPAWQFGKDGKIDGLKLDIAREFSLEGHSYFKFRDYIEFMTAETANISSTIPQQKLRDIFQQAGLKDYKCSLSVDATMNQLADQRDANSGFFDILIKHLDAAVTSGGWDPSGGLSRPFRDKYRIPGLTIDEAYEESFKRNQQNPKP